MFHFYNPLKTSEILRFWDVFRGYRSGTLVENGLKESGLIKHKELQALRTKKFNREYLIL